ncbi:MAG TPA: menaquinone biosynthesis protein [Chthoniobacterales bacterium]|nr:menaquinone biosynthesis protein [Chthoniobacterales bacterium]
MAEPGLLRIGCVKYLNARPLIHGWPGDVVFDHPTALCDRLAAGGLDVALVSSFEFLRNPVYTLVDGISISSFGPVHSVFVAHAGELAEIEEIEVDPASQTSTNLLRCLLAETGLNPKFVIRSRLVQRAITPRLAKFFIGDQAIRFRDESASTFRFWDLGEEWQKRTQQPFVYALWLIRPEVSSPKPIADSLRACRDNNVRDLDPVIAAEREFSPEFCQFYLRDCLRYDFGPPEREGLSTFRKLCERHGILWHDSRLII